MTRAAKIPGITAGEPFLFLYRNKVILDQLIIFDVVADDLIFLDVRIAEHTGQTDELRELGCKIIEISALKGTGIEEAAEAGDIVMILTPDFVFDFMRLYMSFCLCLRPGKKGKAPCYQHNDKYADDC